MVACPEPWPSSYSSVFHDTAPLGDTGASWTGVWALDPGPALWVEPPFLALAPPLSGPL